MDVRVETVPPMRVVFIRHVGPYMQVGQTWGRLFAWAGPRGLVARGPKMIGVCHDDPEVTPPDKLRYDACLVVDGAVRDAAGIEELGFPVFAAGVTPTPPRREREGTIGAPVTCGGLTVHPGDFVYGDRDGVVVVPAERHDEILGRVLETVQG